MRIAIFGSWGSNNERYNFRGDKEDFKRACISLGKEIAKYMHRIIVSGDDESTADRWIVEGVIEVTKTMEIPHPLVEVVEKASRPVFRGNFAKKYSTLFTYNKKQHTWWEGIYLNSVREADVVLTIGGGKGTYSAGLISIIAKKKLVPIGSFGGASEKLLDLLESEETNREIKDRIKALRGDWTDYTRETAVKLMQISSYPRILIIHGKSNDWKDLKKILQDDLELSEVMVMEHMFGEGKTLPEKFESLASQVDAAIAIATPDDVGGLKSDNDKGGLKSDQLKPRARQNVWLEVGWFWGALGRNRIFILYKGDIEIPSDLRGIEVYRYNTKPREKNKQLKEFIQKIREV